jgi:voltage-gated potassium channel
MARVDRRPIPHDLTARRAGLIIAATTLVVALAGGLLIRVFDREDFPSAGSGLWWAVQTVTTVGYGDHVPTSSGGRTIAVLVMVTGIGFMSVVTASITAIFVESARRRRLGQDAVTLDHIAARLDQIEERLQELSGPRP